MSTTNNRLRSVLAVALPIAVLACSYAVYAFIKSNPPEAPKRPPQRSQIVPVEATQLAPQDYTVSLRSYGSVMPRKQTTLVAQVSGVVALVSTSFRAGVAFDKGDVLLALDSSDYEIAVRSAKAALVQARALYTEERARGNQAATDWKKLGKRGKPGALLLRTPQRQSAQAQVQSAQALLERAELDLQRTQIRAPYRGQVLSKDVDEGQFVSTGSSLGVIFARGALDVRLPLNSAQLQHMDSLTIGISGTAVQLVTGSGDRRRYFEAQLVRSEGQVDVNTRQLFVVVEVAADADLAVGQFVEAKLPGKRYRDVFVVPERLVRPEGEVLLAREGLLERAPVQVLYSDGVDAIVSGLAEADVLILTPLGNAIAGTRISATVDGVAPLQSGGDNSTDLGSGPESSQADAEDKASRSQP